MKNKVNKISISKAYLSCLDEEATELFLKDIDSATPNLELAKKGLELFKKLTNNSPLSSIKRICPCGSDKVDVVSCKKTQDHIIELTYICGDCGHTESEEVYLYE